MRVLNKLKSLNRISNKDISYYWQDRFNQDIIDKKKYHGYGGFKYRKFNYFFFKLLNLIHCFYQFFTFKNLFINIIKSESYEIITEFSNRTSTPLDWRKLRHCFSIECLDKFLKNIKTFCVIGDGFATATFLILKKYPKVKIISVNLNKVILDDFIILKKVGLSEKEIMLAENKKDLSYFLNSNKKICFISSDNKLILKNKKIDFFFNMFSFNEMNQKSFNEYKKIIKSCKGYIYSCNPEKTCGIINNKNLKKIFRSPRINFFGSKKIFEKSPIWLNKIYFIKKLNIFGEKYDTKKKIFHTLNKYY